MVLRQPERVNLRRVVKIGKQAVAVKPIVVHEVERRPKQIRHKHRLKASPQKSPVFKGRVQIHAVEESERRHEKKYRHAETRDDFKERDEVNIGRGV